MRKEIFLTVMLSVLCLLLYGCGNHEVESESSASSSENSVSTSNVNTMISGTEILSVRKDMVTSGILNTPDISKPVSVTTLNAVTTANIQSTVVIDTETKVTFKSPSGETEFHQITNKHAQYGERVPTVLKPHEPVIYTTAPPVSTDIETETTVSELEPTEPSEEFTETTVTEEVVIIPEPVTTDEMCYNGMTPGDDIFNLVSSFGEYESLNATPSDYYDENGIQGEDRHYYFPDFEIYTCWFEDREILEEIVVKDSSYETLRGLSIGMDSETMSSLYGFTEYDDKGYIYYPDPESNGLYICFHINEYDEIDYIIYHKDIEQ